MPDLEWQKSSFSSGNPNGDCVELAATATSIHLRESDDPATVLTTTPAATRALLAHLKTGDLVDRPGTE